ncbi:Hsp20/alpha crystallin family protein [Candidatus Gracilibacteria bacterium]|nr:Hsp20/alpha crystallin family protein [Candidatus Gracilibacteria bacterium]
MSKIFGIGIDVKKTQKHEGEHENHVEHHDSGHENHDAHVEIRDHHDTEVDVGQIAVDVLDLTEEIIIIAPVAGVDPSEIDIALSRNILTISGERKHSHLYMDAKRMLVEECYYGPFSRSIILPENLAFNKIKATVDIATIIVHIPKISFFSKSIKIEKETP